MVWRAGLRGLWVLGGVGRGCQLFFILISSRHSLVFYSPLESLLQPCSLNFVFRIFVLLTVFSLI